MLGSTNIKTKIYFIIYYYVKSPRRVLSTSAAQNWHERVNIQSCNTCSIYCIQTKE